MKPVTFDKLCYRIDGRPVHLISGEFHYFRVPKKDWRHRMDLFKEAGGNCLATYVPWLIHEPVEGQFVFGGDDGVTDLDGFLQTANEAGLYVIVRPGPYCYSELMHAGLPDWLVTRYPQLMAKTIAGEPIGPYSISYTHPLLLEKARAWYDRVCPVFAAHQATRGGCVPFVQLDNELTGIHLWYSGPDYNPEAMGLGQADGPYGRFLRKRYGDIASLNAAYETDLADFADVRPILGEHYTAAEIRRLKDYFDFYLSTIGDYCRALAAMCRANGIDVPLVHNSANASMDALFTDTVAAMGNTQFLLGSDHYYNLEGQNNPTPEYAVKAFYSCEMLRLMGFPPTVYELPSGQNFDFPPTLCEDERTCYMTNVAYGMKGHNYYIYTGGPNPPGAGTTGDVYDFNAPVGADNEIRPLYRTQKAFHEFLLARPWLCEAQRECDFRVALDWEHSRASYYWKQRGDFLLTNAEAWDLLRKGLLTTAFSASLSPTLVDLAGDDWLDDCATPVVVVSSAVMARSAQQRLARFCQAGGKLMLIPVVPSLDERLEPCTLLADALGGLRSRRGRGGVRPTFGEPAQAVYGAGAFFTDHRPAEIRVAGQDQKSGEPLAWAADLPGGGQFGLLSLRWNHSRHHHEHMLREALKLMGLQPKVSCSNPYVWTSLRTAGRRSTLFLMNLFTGALSAEVSCTPAWAEGPIDLGTRDLPPMSVLTIDLP